MRPVFDQRRRLIEELERVEAMLTPQQTVTVVDGVKWWSIRGGDCEQARLRIVELRLALERELSAEKRMEVYE